MATFALVGCAQPSLQETGPAYLMCRTVPGFAEAWEQASKEADATLILSPDYGLVYPDEDLRPGDVGLGDERFDHDPQAWLTRVQRELGSLRWLEARHRWLLRAEGAWADHVAAFLRENGQEVERSSVRSAS